MEEEEAAVRIQCLHRQKVARNRISRKRAERQQEKELEHQERSALVIQSRLRARADKKYVDFVRTQHKMATKIQSVHRGNRARRQVMKRKGEGLPLTQSLMKQGLHTLGKSPKSLKFAFISLTLRNEGLSDVSLLASFPHLQHIDLHDNSITNLSPLSHLPFLLTLNLSKNKLEGTCLDYQTTRCQNIDDRWATEKASHQLGSLLQDADLSFNELVSLQGLGDRHPFLHSLNLSYNRIPSLQGLSSLNYLHTLNVANNQLSSLIGLTSGLYIQTLIISNNNLTSLEGIECLPYLRFLDATSNQIQTILPALEQPSICEGLSTLLLDHNPLEGNLSMLLPLASRTYLEHLSLQNTPLISYISYYRWRVVHALPLLASLDGQRIAPEEKVKANSVMGSEVAFREKHFAESFPKKPFFDFMPPLSTDERESEASLQSWSLFEGSQESKESIEASIKSQSQSICSQDEEGEDLEEEASVQSSTSSVSVVMSDCVRDYLDGLYEKALVNLARTL